MLCVVIVVGVFDPDLLVRLALRLGHLLPDLRAPLGCDIRTVGFLGTLRP